MLKSPFNQNEQKNLGIKDHATNFLKEKNIKYQTAEDDSCLIFSIEGENGNFRVIFCIDEERELVQIRSYCPIIIKENQKLRIADLIARINDKMIFGCFTLNSEEGAVVYKTSHLVSGTELNFKTLDILYITNARSLDEYLPAISAVNSGYTEPFMAIQ